MASALQEGDKQATACGVQGKQDRTGPRGRNLGAGAGQGRFLRKQEFWLTLKDKWECSPGQGHRMFKDRNLKLASVAGSPELEVSRGGSHRAPEDGGLYGGDWELLKVIYRECYRQLFS